MKGYPEQISNNIIREVESSGDYLFDLHGGEKPLFSGKKVTIMIDKKGNRETFKNGMESGWYC